jgi:glutaredoxin
LVLVRWVRLGWLACVLTLVCTSAGAGCKRATAASTADAEALPVVRDGVEGFLFTWIDDKGDFHVETRLGDVPMMGRDSVRVESQNEESPNPDRVFVVDLRQPGAGGGYPVRTMTRVEFEAIAVARREKTGPTLASAAPSAPPAPGAAPTASPAARPLVIIYGAEWCGACHDAARYLRHKGIPYVEKDIEKDPAAAREMQEKLAKHGMNAGSIPVIDVRGTVMVGFNPPAIDSALGQPM